MKKTLAKILALALCAVLLVTGTVFVTLAYLQDTTTVVKNTFSGADIAITLHEAKLDEDGKPTGARTDTNATDGNAYRLIPGNEYTKDPTVTVGANSEECFLVIAIHDTMFWYGENDIEADYQKKGKIYDQIATNGWLQFTDAPTTIKHIPDEWDDEYTFFYYAGTSSKTDVTVTSATIPTSNAPQDKKIFEGFKISGQLSDEAQAAITGAKDAGSSFEIIAFAFQTSGFGPTDNMNPEEIIKHAFVTTFGTSKDTTDPDGGITGT